LKANFVSSREFKETIARLHTSALDRSLTSALTLAISLVAICLLAWSVIEFWDQLAHSMAALRLRLL
jgi:hypothetical protein